MNQEEAIMAMEDALGMTEIPIGEPEGIVPLGLEERVATLERLVAALVVGTQKPARKKRSWTPEQTAEVRARLLAGQSVA